MIIDLSIQNINFQSAKRVFQKELYFCISVFLYFCISNSNKFSYGVSAGVSVSTHSHRDFFNSSSVFITFESFFLGLQWFGRLVYRESETKSVFSTRIECMTLKKE
jgi:hypothetical protein